jgi:hypothetical protein
MVVSAMADSFARILFPRGAAGSHKISNSEAMSVFRRIVDGGQFLAGDLRLPHAAADFLSLVLRMAQNNALHAGETLAQRGKQMAHD